MIRVSSFGKVEASWRDELNKRVSRLIPFEWKEIPLKKSPDKRSSVLLPEEKHFLESYSSFFILDVGGKVMDSDQFYSWLFKAPERHLVVGPAAGFHSEFKKRAQGSISLSALTLTHKLAQTVLAESIYRSVCILKNHPFVK